MVRNYKKKSDRCSWSDGNLKLAVDSINAGKSIKSAALEYGIPRSTLQRKFKGDTSINTGKNIEF